MPGEATTLTEPKTATGEPGSDMVEERSSTDLDGKLASGVAWLGGMRWLSQALAWATTLLVARVLESDAYGVVAVTTIIIGVGGFFTESGVARALILRGIRDRELHAQVHGLCIAIGLAFALALALGAPLFAAFFEDARLIAVLRLLAIVPLLTGLFSVPFARLQQGLDYGRIARVDFTRSIAQALTVLTCAYAGAGYWSLVAGILATHVAGVVLALQNGWVRPRRPQWTTVRFPVSYGWHLTASVLLWHTYSNADRAVSGRILDLATVGLYQFAASIAALPGEKITNVLQSVAAPFFGNLGGDVMAMRRYLLVMTETIALLVWPLLVGFILVADQFLPLVFGEQWRGAVPPLQLLVVAALAQNLAVLINLVLASAGRADVIKWASAVLVVVLPPLFWYGGTRAGIVGIASVWAIVQPVMLLVPLFWSRRLLGLPMREYAATLRGPIAACAVMSVVVLALDRLAVGEPVHYRLALTIPLGALSYAAVILLFFRARVEALRGVWLAGRRAA